MNQITHTVMKLNPALAGKILISICSILVAFHASNYLGKIPVNVTWLGRIDSNSTVKIMSLLSIVLNTIIIVCAAVKLNYIDSARIKSIVEKALPIVFWWLVGNSIANLFAKSTFEVVVFTPVLIVLTACVFVIKNTDSKK